MAWSDRPIERHGSVSTTAMYTMKAKAAGPVTRYQSTQPYEAQPRTEGESTHTRKKHAHAKKACSVSSRARGAPGARLHPKFRGALAGVWVAEARARSTQCARVCELRSLRHMKQTP